MIYPLFLILEHFFANIVEISGFLKAKKIISKVLPYKYNKIRERLFWMFILSRGCLCAQLVGDINLSASDVGEVCSKKHVLKVRREHLVKSVLVESRDSSERLSKGATNIDIASNLEEKMRV